MEILQKLFINWDLETWANVLEVVGFFGGVATLFISLWVKSKVDKLKNDYILNRRIGDHIKKLSGFTGTVNQLFANYDTNRNAIKIELATLQSELEDLSFKLEAPYNSKTKALIKFLKSKRKNKLVSKAHIDHKRIPRFILNYTRTTYDDIWTIHSSVHEIIRQLDNIKENSKKSL